ncbi:CidA/LrgA family protein [Glaciecola sp. 2405UD65-10]|uniref:CidA/LrgA family protein n=1 Tax=Glaciecola sp. 2405UD65-10 TaxID=3397244 RepID=UPI003B59871C
MFVTSQIILEYFNISLPGAILGIFVLLVALVLFRRVPNSIELASKPLLTYMSLFFVPAIVAIVNYTQLILQFPWALFLAIVVSTLLSLGLTALIAQKLMHALNTPNKGNSNASE